MTSDLLRVFPCFTREMTTFGTIRDLASGVFFALALVTSSAEPASASAADITWSELPDQQAQSYEDPFRDLSESDIQTLARVARLEESLYRPETQVAEQRRISAELDTLKAGLAEQGIDADWLIPQRWDVADRRKLAATAGNPKLDGAEVSIAGFAIPAPPDEDGTPMAYLVEQRGMCSHTPPPLPNQLIRVRLVEGWQPNEMHEPVRLVGHLHIDPGKQMLRVVDGDVSMDATWRLDANGVETISGGIAGAQGSSDWVTQLRAKLKSGPDTGGQ